MGTTEGVAAAGYALFSLAMAAGRFSGDKLTELLGAASLVRLGGLLGALGFSTVVPLAFSAAGESSKTPSAAIAFVSACGYGGFLLGPAVIGFFAELTALSISLATVIALSVLVAITAGAVGDRREPAYE